MEPLPGNESLSSIIPTWACLHHSESWKSARGLVSTTHRAGSLHVRGFSRILLLGERSNDVICTSYSKMRQDNYNLTSGYQRLVRYDNFDIPTSFL